MARTPQPRVPPESVSWCIDRSSLEEWDRSGNVLQKAHQSHVAKTRWHRADYDVHAADCGATIEHRVDACAPAPANWPACRHCWRKAELVSVPAVFQDA